MANEDEVRNLGVVVTMLGEQSDWLTVKTSDLKGALSELHRLERVESALLHAIDWKITRADAARRAGDEAARKWQIEEKVERRIEERMLRAEAYLLARIEEGKEVG